MSLPILYSFRRCPYAIRARLAVYHSSVHCELREIVLKNKPSDMLSASPKGTVPVLVLEDGGGENLVVENTVVENMPAQKRVIDESLDIMRWVLTESNDSTNQHSKVDEKQIWQPSQLNHDLIKRNDAYFKSWLDKYKYFDRHPEQSQCFYFEKAVIFLHELEASFVPCEDGGWALVTSRLDAIDAAIFPFVRQFAFVDRGEFDKLPLPKLLYWLDKWLNSQLFKNVMDKYPAWSPDQSEKLVFGRKD